MSRTNPIVVFDGVCNLCSTGVRFILRNDRSKQIQFTTIQSQIGQQLLLEYGIDPLDVQTFLYIKDGLPFTRSAAALEIATNFGFWRCLRIFGILPQSWRDAAYRMVAKNRYRWFGKREICYLPTEQERRRFLD